MAFLRNFIIHSPLFVLFALIFTLQVTSVLSNEGDTIQHRLKLIQARITEKRSSPDTNVPDPCECTCDHDHTQDNSSDTATSSGGCGCGCGCCANFMCNSTMKQMTHIFKKTRHRPDPSTEDEPRYFYCELLSKLYDDYQVALDYKSLVEDINKELAEAITVGSETLLDSPSTSPEDLSPLLASLNLTSQEEKTISDYKIALAMYSATWTQLDILINYMSETHPGNTTIFDCGVNCTDDENWVRGCSNCIPEIDLTPTCEPPIVCTENETDSCSSSQGYCTSDTCDWKEDPHPYKCIGDTGNCACCIVRTCSNCTYFLVDVLVILNSDLQKIQEEIDISVKELSDCLNQEDAAHKAEAIKAKLVDLMDQMYLILEQINLLSATPPPVNLERKKRSEPSNSIDEKIKEVEAYITSLHLGTTFEGQETCNDKNYTAVNLVIQLYFKIKAISLSPLNDNLQFITYCNVIKIIPTMLEISKGSIKLTQDEVKIVQRFLKGIQESLEDADENIHIIKQNNEERQELLKKEIDNLEEKQKQLMKEKELLETKK